MSSERSFEELVAEADSVSVDGWDFSWLEGRATEQRPSWGYQRQMAVRLARSRAALDIETGRGEVLDGAATLPPVMAATEGARVHRGAGPQSAPRAARADPCPGPVPRHHDPLSD